MDKADGFENLGKVKWELAFSLLGVFVIVYFALWKGIKSSGKVSRRRRRRLLLLCVRLLICSRSFRRYGLQLLLHMLSCLFS